MFLFNIENQMLLAKGRKTVFNFTNSNISKIAGAFSFSRKKVNKIEKNINNTKAKAKRQEGVKINESNRNSKADRRPRTCGYTKGDPPHDAYKRGRPFAYNIDSF